MVTRCCCSFHLLPFSEGGLPMTNCPAGIKTNRMPIRLVYIRVSSAKQFPVKQKTMIEKNTACTRCRAKKFILVIPEIGSPVL